ncbi:MAG: glycosyltransferase [Alphaproteobacteria bacterium]|nr:glycosyltransferase [Alphaproteobacteria bacterium]
MPKISIIVPVYNVEKYLSRCLDSVLAQTFDDFEIICVNDGSVDCSGKILNKFAAKDDRVKIITQRNGGLSVARNNGVLSAKGEYIYFLDSDDAIQPQTLEILHTLSQKHSADLVTIDYADSDGIEIPNKNFNLSKIKYKVTNKPLFCGCSGKYRVPVSACTKLYKKELLHGIEFIPNIHFEDYPHTYAVLLKHPKSVVTNIPLYLYTKNIDSISNQKASVKQIKDYHQGISYLYERYKDRKKELRFLIKDFMPIILKHQLGRCTRASSDIKPFMFKAFSEELRDLNQKGLFSWRGHKIGRYLKYRRLIKGCF